MKLKVIVSGVVVDIRTFFSDKRGRDVCVVTLFSDGDTVKVYDFPIDCIDVLTLYESVDIPCRIFEGNKGIGFSYAK